MWEATNPYYYDDGTVPHPFTATDIQLLVACTVPLGLTVQQGSLTVPPFLKMLPPPEHPAKQCHKPRLGKLCGKDAIGAIIGIALGGLLLLCMLLALILCGRGGKVSAAGGGNTFVD